MDPITMIVAAVVGGITAAAGTVAGQAVKDAYAGLKGLILLKFSAKAGTARALEEVEKNPQSEGRKAVLKEELEKAGAAQDTEVLQLAQKLLDVLAKQSPAATVHAELHGSGAIAQGPGAVAAGERGVAAGGNIQGSTVVTGDRNVVHTGAGNVQTGGIRARHIQADNVVDGVQMQGGSPEMAAGLVELAHKLQRGGISADEIVAGNVVSGLQYIHTPAEATPENLRREVEALRAKLDKAIAEGGLPHGQATNAKDAREELAKADEELGQPEPGGARVMRTLKGASEILAGLAETAQKLGQVGSEVLKLAPVAAALWQIAVKLFGG